MFWPVVAKTAAGLFFAMSYADDLAEMIDDLPIRYTILGNQYTGAINEISNGQDAGEGGFLDDFDLTIIGKQTDHSTLPDIGTKVSLSVPVHPAVVFPVADIGATVFRIEKITTTGDGAEVRFDLMNASR